mmetsp:Transcript_28076/g.70508  ORF Transcript_28076/g.70508 Transcript_28076/m.70508 type:complete len:94 (-) Transcript_28076:89-370(-)
MECPCVSINEVSAACLAQKGEGECKDFFELQAKCEELFPRCSPGSAGVADPDLDPVRVCEETRKALTACVSNPSSADGCMPLANQHQVCHYWN